MVRVGDSTEYGGLGREFFCKSYENTSDENKKAPTSARAFVVPMGQLSSFDTEDLLKIFEFLEVLNPWR